MQRVAVMSKSEEACCKMWCTWVREVVRVPKEKVPEGLENRKGVL